MAPELTAELTGAEARAFVAKVAAFREVLGPREREALGEMVRRFVTAAEDDVAGYDDGNLLDRLIRGLTGTRAVAVAPPAPVDWGPVLPAVALNLDADLIIE